MLFADDDDDTIRNRTEGQRLLRAMFLDGLVSCQEVADAIAVDVHKVSVGFVEGYAIPTPGQAAVLELIYSIPASTWTQKPTQ